MAQLLLVMEQFTLVNCFMALRMDTVNRSGRMEANTTDSGRMTKQMVMVS